MLFVFDSEGVARFYMWQTPMPLDIAFLDADGRFVDSAEMEPCLEPSSALVRALCPRRAVLDGPRGARRRARRPRHRSRRPHHPLVIGSARRRRRSFWAAFDPQRDPGDQPPGTGPEAAHRRQGARDVAVEVDATSPLPVAGPGVDTPGPFASRSVRRSPRPALGHTGSLRRDSHRDAATRVITPSPCRLSAPFQLRRVECRQARSGDNIAPRRRTHTPIVRLLHRIRSPALAHAVCRPSARAPGPTRSW